jgi:homeobox-leucine zipper protein
VPASYTGWRLLPSGCLVEDMPNGYCKASAVLLLLSQSVNSNVETLNFKLSCALQITWVVHAEYDEATVPTMFRPLFRSGKALGAHRWLASLQRQCEYLAVLHSSQAPRGDNTGQSFYGQQGNCPYITSYGLISWEQLSDIHIYISALFLKISTAAAISSMGKRGILKLAQRMMAVFYSAVSGPVTQPSSKLYEWPASAGTGARRTDAAVRMVTWKKAGSVAVLVLSATTTVWLPNTPPQLVFQYLCDGQRRGEWDAFANGAAVTELCSVATGHLHGNNVVSVLYSNVSSLFAVLASSVITAKSHWISI